MSKQVIIKKYGDKRTIWLSERLLVSYCGVDSDYLAVRCRSAYKESVKENQRGLEILPQTGKAWRWAKFEGKFYYDYDNVPNREPKCYRDKLPSEAELLRIGNGLVDDEAIMLIGAEKLENLAENKEKREAVIYYMYECGVKKMEEAMALADAWAMMRVIFDKIHNNGWISVGLESKADLVRCATMVLARRGLKGLKISNENGLRNKIKDFGEVLHSEKYEKNKEFDFFVHGGLGNNNSMVVGKVNIVDEETGEVLCHDVHQVLIYNAFMNRFNAAKEFKQTLYDRYYLPTIENLGYRAVSYRSFCRHTDMFSGKMKMAKSRHGFDYFNKKYHTYIPAQALQYSHSMFVMDGSGTKIAYQNGKGVATLYMNRCFDAASGALVGFSLHPTHKGAETTAHVQAMLKMVLKNTKGYGAFELLTDNGGAYQKAEMQAMFKLVFNRVRAIAPGNSQANPAEQYNRLMNDQARQFDNWSGQYQASNIEFKANTDGVTMRSLPSIETAYAQVMEMVEHWNAQVGIDGLSRWERFEAKKHTKIEELKLNDKTQRYVNGNTTRIDVAHTRGIIGIERQGQRWQFLLENWATAAEQLNKALGWGNDLVVDVRWDETGADLYHPDGTYLMTAVPFEKAHKSYAEATEESEDAFGKLVNRKRSVVDAVRVFEEETKKGLEVMERAFAITNDDTNDISEPIDYAMLKVQGVAKEDSNEQYEQQYNKKISGAEKALLDTF